MLVDICRHIKTNGSRCGTPSLKDKSFCYFHEDSARRHRSLSPFHDEPAVLHPICSDHRDRAQRDPMLAEYYHLHPKHGPVELDFPPLEDRESIQLALSMVVAALAQNRIDAKRAAPILYGLQVASANARSLDLEPQRSKLVSHTVLTDSGIEIAPDEIPESEIDRQRFIDAIAQDCAIDDEEGEEEDYEYEDDKK